MSRRSGSRRSMLITAGAGALVAALTLAVPSPALCSPELAIGARGADFKLKGTDMKMYTLADVSGEKGTALIFTCNECPFSVGYEDRLIALAKKYQSRGIGFVAINPNDPAIVPGDGFEQMVTRAKKKKFHYPYVVDTTQATAAAYGARVTPHIFLLDADGKLVYRGRVDDSVKENEVTSRDFELAMQALVNGRPVPVSETKAFGCSVKWSKKKSA